MQMLTAPRSVRADAHECWIKVCPDKVMELRNQLGGAVTRNKVFQWVDPAFKVLADEVYCVLSSPSITLMTAWGVFEAMVNALDEFRADIYVA